MEKYEITVNGEVFQVTLQEVTEFKEEATSNLDKSKPAETATSAPAPAADLPADSVEISAPIAGTIYNIIVDVGEEVQQGDTLIVLEAMKMEHEIIAPKEGVIQNILVNESQFVDSKQLLLTM